MRSVVPSEPKPLARFGQWSFLELLVRQLRHQGIRRIVLCTGYRASQIEGEFSNGHSLDVMIEYSTEVDPLGTAGALKLAERHLQDVPHFLVMNGDSFVEIDFNELMCFHRQHDGLVSMAVRRVDNAGRYGTVHTDARKRIARFAEKTGESDPGLVNAGVCVFSREAMSHIPTGPSSLEMDVYPQLLQYGVYASEQYGLFIDIGTPDDYARAQQLCDQVYGVAFRTQWAAPRVSHACIEQS